MKYAGLFAIALAIGCGETTSSAPGELTLDRPNDITFGCFGPLRITEGRTTGAVEDPVELTAMPTTACDIRSGEHDTGAPVPVPPGQEDLTADGGIPIGNAFWFGFILQRGPGTVVVVNFQTKPSTAFTGGDISTLDADPLTPGKNAISVGEDPVGIVTDKAGCKVVTANAGSCDLSVLDVATAVDFDVSTPIDVRRLEVTNAAGEPLRAKPAAIVAEPATDVIGNRCTADATGLVYVAYPSCHLVAAVDASTGTVVSGIQFGDTGPTLVDGNVTCPDECSGGATITAGVRPVTIDLEQDVRVGTRRMVIGADNSAALTVVELDPTTTLPQSVSQVELEDPAGDLGVLQVAMSPQIGMGGQVGAINDDTGAGGQFQFVYAIATDHTVRVADILDVHRECDTQVDPRFLRDIRSVKELSCLPAGDPARPRRAGVQGPGIELVGDAFPVSVDIIKSPEVAGDSRPSPDPNKLIGYFAVIGASNGATFLANIDDDDNRDLFEPDSPLFSPVPDIIAHQLRDAISQRFLTAVDDEQDLPICDVAGPSDASGIVVGGPRTTTNPQRNVPSGVFAPEKVTELPGIRQLKCEGVDLNGAPSVRAVSELGFAAPDAVRDLAFPDLRALRGEETWTLTWEGTVSLDAFTTDVDGPQIRESELRVDDQGMHLVDQSRPFCNAGVEPFDIVQLRGCDPGNGDAECPSGYRCFVHPNSQIQGLGACLLDDEADRLADACEDFLTSSRRFTVVESTSGVLELIPRRHVLRTTPVEGCVSDAQCDVLADFQAKESSSLNPVDDTATDERTWRCEADASHGPVDTGKRCTLRCDATEDCVLGTVCQGGTPGSGTKTGYCMEGVVPPQACINAPQRYQLRVGDAFAVLGELTGFEHATIADASGACVRDPDASPLLTSRIPLNPPACAADADPLTGRRPDGTFEPNPCSLTVDQTELAPIYNEGTCTLGPEPTELITRQAPAIRYRNRGITMTIVDPFYPGDESCILDRAGLPGAETTQIPLVFTGYQIGFRQTAGFVTQPINLTTTFPVKIVRGPTNSIWVLDEGDFLSTSIAFPSTRGQVFRIEPSALNRINVIQ